MTINLSFVDGSNLHINLTKRDVLWLVAIEGLRDCAVKIDLTGVYHSFQSDGYMRNFGYNFGYIR